MIFLEHVVDGEVFVDESEAAVECLRGQFRSEALESAVSNAIVLPEIAVNGVESVVGLPCDKVWIFAFGIAFPADDPFVGETGANIMQGGSAGDDGLGGAFMFGEDFGDGGVAGVEKFGEVAVGEQRSLLVGLFAEPAGAVQEAFLGRPSVEALLDVIGGAEIENDGDEIDVGDALPMARRIIEADGHPEDLAVGDVLEGTEVLGQDFEEHIGAELADAGTADAGELGGNAVRDGVFEGFAEQRREFLGEEIGLAAHGRTSFGGASFFFRPQVPRRRSYSR